MSIASWTSPPASASTLPISRLMSSASASFCWVRSAAKRYSTSARRGAGTRRQRSYALRALAAVDDHLDVRVVLVVVDELVVELALELWGNDAVDHRPVTIGIPGH